MKTITVKVNNDKSSEILTEMLKAMNFVESIEVYEEDDDKLTAEEINMVEERWEEYKRNPESALSWEEIRNKIKKKHGI